MHVITQKYPYSNYRNAFGIQFVQTCPVVEWSDFQIYSGLKTTQQMSLVVSIDLFLVFFMPFSYSGVYFRQREIFTLSIPPLVTFHALKLFFIFSLFLRKEERRASKIFVPAQRNVRFILHCTFFD